MDRLFTSFKSLLNKIYLFYKRRNVVLKFIILALPFILTWVFLPFIYNNIMYRLPNENGINLEGRSATAIKDEKLYFLKYVSRKECQENKISASYVLEKIADINCVRVYTLSSLQRDEIPSTALLGDDVVIFSKLENDNYNIYKWQNGESNLVKSIPIFDLEAFRIKLASSTLALADINTTHTGYIYKVKFKVIDQNTIGFLDAYVTKVDNKMPVEVTVRERRLNIFNGNEDFIDVKIQKLDIQSYNYFLNNAYEENIFKWSFFISFEVIFNYIGYTLADVDELNRVFILDTGKIERERESLDIYDCKYYSYWISMPCLGVYYESILFKKNNTLLNTTILSRYAAPGMGAQILSDDERYLAFYLDRGDPFWINTNKILIFNYLYDINTKDRTLLGKGYRFVNIK